MAEKQIQKLAGRLVEHQNFFGELSIEDRQWTIQNPKEAIGLMCKAIAERERGGLKVWKTVELGTGLRTVEDFRHALEEGGFRISNWANDIMSQPAFAQSLTDANRERKYELVKMTTAQLTGKENGGTTAEVFAGADNLGLEKCPPWMGPKSRLDYHDQPMGEWLRIGMEPITDSDGDLDVFDVERDGDGLWLDGGCGDPVSFWFGGDGWVFVRPAS